MTDSGQSRMFLFMISSSTRDDNYEAGDIFIILRRFLVVLVGRLSSVDPLCVWV